MWKTTLYTGSLICIVAQLQHIAPKICVSETSRAYWELTRCGPFDKICLSSFWVSFESFCRVATKSYNWEKIDHFGSFLLSLISKE